MQKPYGIRHILDQELNYHKKMFTQQSEIQISVITWNCAGNPPLSDEWDISDTLKDNIN